MQIYEKHPGLPSHLKMLFLLLGFLETGIRLAVTTRLSCAMKKRAIDKFELFVMTMMATMMVDHNQHQVLIVDDDGDNLHELRRRGWVASLSHLSAGWWVVGDTYRKLCNGDERELFIVKMIRLMLQQMVHICIIKIMSQFSMFHFKFENFIPSRALLCQKSMVLPSWSAGPLWWAYLPPHFFTIFKYMFALARSWFFRGVRHR